MPHLRANRPLWPFATRSLVFLTAWAGLACGSIAQGPGSRTDGASESSNPAASSTTEGGPEPSSPTDVTDGDRATMGLWERLISTEPDPVGPINTDRPTFTPANTVVPRGRLQIESGFTYTATDNGSLRTLNRGRLQASAVLSPTPRSALISSRTNAFDFPELAVRVGLTSRIEFRTFWLGQTYSRGPVGTRNIVRDLNGPSDMEFGFKTQLIVGDPAKPWIPTTALITSVIAPTGGSSSLFSSEVVEPSINLIYGWSLTKKLSLAGSTGYLGIRQKIPGRPADSFERYNQSVVAFYTATKRTTLFYEYYVFAFTNSGNNLPLPSMDGGALYRPTPNTQFDIRAGFGLRERPSELFTGVGFSCRF